MHSLAEAIFFSFNPAVPALSGWELSVLGSKMDPVRLIASAAIAFCHGRVSIETHL